MFSCFIVVVDLSEVLYVPQLNILRTPRLVEDDVCVCGACVYDCVYVCVCVCVCVGVCVSPAVS